MPKLPIKSDERLLIVGKTGSGKTYFTRYFLREAKRLIVCDSKRTIDNNDWGLVDFDAKQFGKLKRDPLAGLGAKDKPIRLRLRIDAKAGSPPAEDQWASYFLSFLELRNTQIYIDELRRVSRFSQSEELRALFTQGRELGNGVAAGTQRPARIPRESMTEAEHYIVFQIKDDDDEKRIYEYVGNAGYAELARYGKSGFVDLAKYQFLYYGEEENRAVLFNKLNVRAPGDRSDNGD